MSVVTTPEELDGMNVGTSIQVQDRIWTRQEQGWVCAENPDVPVRSEMFFGLVRSGQVSVGSTVAAGQWWVSGTTGLFVLDYDESADMVTVLMCSPESTPSTTRKRPRTIRNRYRLEGNQVPTTLVCQELTQYLANKVLAQQGELAVAATQSAEVERLQLKRNQERQTQMETFVAGVTRSLEEMSNHVAAAMRGLRT